MVHLSPVVLRLSLIVGGLVVGTMGVGGCATSTPTTTSVVTKVSDIGAIAAMTDGGFVFGERASGDINSVDADLKVAPAILAHVDVSSAGQRGLLGVAVDGRRRVFAAWTAAGGDQRITIAQVAPGSQRLVWSGPPSQDLANGGHLVFAPDGRLVIGIGDLTDRSKTTNPTFPNGKLLSFDPDGPPSQTPRVVSSGWNNPFAFTYLPDGSLWIADNSPGEEPERLARVGTDGTASNVLDIGRHTVPSALVAIGTGSIYACTYADGHLQRYEVTPNTKPNKKGSTLVRDCAATATVINDGSIVYASPDAIRRIVVH